MSSMQAESTTNNVRNISDSRKQALHALISSLSPADAPDSTKLDDEQASKLSERLDQILGAPGDGGQERRNEKGELLNEEGLPIIDITEPASDLSSEWHPPNPFVTEQDPAPLSSLNGQERLSLRARTNRILDILEAEEEQEESQADELEHQRQRESLAKRQEEAEAERKRKQAAREMQKRMGKALLKNFAEQREREEVQRAEEESKAKEKASSDAGDSKKPKKRVSFANVGVMEDDVHKSKPKRPLAWGDVSVGALKGGINRVRYKTDEMERQTMKFEVVERLPGARGLVVPEIRDSDDESDPDDQGEEKETTGQAPTFNADEYTWSDSESTGSAGSGKDDEEGEEDEFDFSQAQLQREIALEYIRLRGTIGAEAHQAMTSHTHSGENEWDQPEVPLEATLASKPPKPNVSRFKMSRHSAAVSAGSTSISLGPSVLPSGESHTLKRAVRTGKLSDGKLVGGEAGESASEDEEDENRQRMLNLFKSGVPIPFEDSESSRNHLDVIRHDDTNSNSGDQRIHSPEGLKNATSEEPRVPRKSKFLSDRAGRSSSPALQPNPSGGQPTQPVASSSRLPDNTPVTDVLSDISERKPLESSINTQPVERSAVNGVVTETAKPFKKSPTVVSVPNSAPSQRTPRSSAQVIPDPAVLGTVVIDSPSFPPLSKMSDREVRPTPVVGEVRESVRTGTANLNHQKPTRGIGGRVSRFKAERS